MPELRNRAPRGSGQTNSSRLFLDTRGQPTLGIAICTRCQTKRMLAELTEDGNLPGFYVCLPSISPGCFDQFDPFRKSAPPPDDLRLPIIRPDVALIAPPPEVVPILVASDGGSLLSFGPISGGPISGP